MKPKFWFITYSWKSEQKRIVSHDVHIGSIWSWVNKALEQPEQWRLLNQIEIDKTQYLNLKERI